MFDDLVSLFSGWYMTYLADVRDALQSSEVIVNQLPDGNGDYVTQTLANDINPAIWSAYIPWEQIIATVVLVTFVVCIFKFMRSVLCKIL